MTSLRGHNLDIITFPSHHYLLTTASLTLTSTQVPYLITWHFSFIDFPQSYGLYLIQKLIHCNGSSLPWTTPSLVCLAEMLISALALPSLFDWSISDSSKSSPPFSWISSFAYAILWIWLLLCLSFLTFLSLPKICHFFSFHSPSPFQFCPLLHPLPSKHCSQSFS